MKSLMGALLKAQGAVKAVAKDSVNNYSKYAYASSDDVIAEARRVLVEAGLVFMTTGWVPRQETTGDGQVVGRMEVSYRLVHPESGESQDIQTSTPVLPEKGRPEDKAEATALTYNLGYTLRGLLLIPRGDSDEPDRRDDRAREPQRAPERQERPAASQGLVDRAVEVIRQAETADKLDALGPQLHADNLASHPQVRAAFSEKKAKFADVCVKVIRAAKDVANLDEAMKMIPANLKTAKVVQLAETEKRKELEG